MLEESLTLANNHIAFLTGLTGEKLKTFGLSESSKGSISDRKQCIMEQKQEPKSTNTKNNIQTPNMLTLTEILNVQSKVALSKSNRIYQNDYLKLYQHSSN